MLKRAWVFWTAFAIAWAALLFAPVGTSRVVRNPKGEVSYHASNLGKLYGMAWRLLVDPEMDRYGGGPNPWVWAFGLLFVHACCAAFVAMIVALLHSFVKRRLKLRSASSA